MKNILQILLSALVMMFMTRCEKEEHLVTYPESYPVIEQAAVDESVITYDDSISVHVTLSDRVTPLSTLEVQVVLNNEVLTSETIRTKGNSAEVNRRYAIPFGANRIDNAAVKVYLTSINVDGYTRDTIINSTVVKRPVIDNLWIVPVRGKSYKLTLIDSVNLIYYASGLTYDDTVSYRLATKVDKFFKVDWTGLVFGKVGDGIGIVGKLDDPITSSDITLVGISEITFDAMQLTTDVGGKLLEPVTTLDINADLPQIVVAGKDFRGGNIFFGEGIEVTFTGLDDLNKSLPPDYFEVTGANTAVFLGKSAIYKTNYYIAADYMYVEPQPEVKYPDALWITGTGFGHPSPPYEVTSSWNWNTPFDYAPCRKVSDGIYQVTIYGKNTDGGSGFGTLDFKFFLTRGWGNAPFDEINASTYTVSAPFIGRSDAGNVGNVNAGTTPTEGVFKITINQNTKTIDIVKVN